METLKQPLYSHAGGTIIHTGDREQGSRSLGLDGSPARLNRAGRSGLGCRGDRAEHPANRCTGRSDSHRRVAGAGPLSVGCSCGTVPPRFARCLRSGRGRCRPQWTAATGADGHPSPSVPPAVLKPIADRIRRTPPFGSPKPEGQQDQARQNTGGNRRRQDNPPRGGTDARVHRRGRWQAQFSAPSSGVRGRPGIAGLHHAPGLASRGPSERVPRSACGGAPPPHCRSPPTGLRHVGARPVGRHYGRQASLLLGATLRASPAEAGGGPCPL